MKGLKQKYKIEKANGEPVDPRAKFFVLRYDQHKKNQAHARASQEALKTYAAEIAESNDILASDLFYELEDIDIDIDSLGDTPADLVKEAKEFIKLRDLKMHESTTAGGWAVTRVPGGFLYAWFENNVPTISTFVPEPMEVVSCEAGKELMIEIERR